MSIELITTTVGEVVVTVHGVDAAATTEITLVDEERGLRNPLPAGTSAQGLAAGRYHVEVASEGPIVHIGEVAVSSSNVVRSGAFDLAADGFVAVALG